MRFLRGIAAGVLLLGCSAKDAELAENARRAIAGDERDATEPVVNEAYRIQLESPGVGWKLLDAGAAVALSPDALLGAVSTQPVAAVLAARPVTGRSLDELIRLRVAEMAPDDEPRLEANEIKGHPARRYAFTRDGVRHAGAVWLDGGLGFELRVWGFGTLVEDASRALFESIAMLEGARKPVARTLDQSGGHWRVRDGAYENAASGMRARAPAGVRLVVGMELDRLEPQADLVLEALDVEARLYVASEPAPGMPTVPSVPGGRAQILEAALGGEPGPSLPLEVLGMKVELARRKRGDDVSAHVELCESGWCHLLLARYRSAAEKEATLRIAEAAAALVRMPEPERTALAKELEVSESFRCAMGDGYVFRGDSFQSFAHGYSLSGLRGWDVSAGPRSARRSPAAHAFLEERSLGLEGAAIADANAGSDPAAYHQTVLEGLAVQGFKPSAAQRKMGELLVSSGSAALGMDFWVGTFLADGRGVQLSFWGAAANVRAHEEPIKDALGGFRASLDRAVDTPPGGVLDRRLGVTISMPAGWRMQDETPAELAPMGFFSTWEQNARWVGAIGMCLPSDAPPDWFARYLEQLLRDRFGTLAMAAATDGHATLAGRRGRRVSWHTPIQRIDAVVLTRGNAVYALVAADHKDEALHRAMDGFAWTD